MKATIDMAREAGFGDYSYEAKKIFEIFESLVRADEREQGQKWFDAVTAQNKQLILAEREACAKVCDEVNREYDGEEVSASWVAAAIRNRGNT